MLPEDEIRSQSVSDHIDVQGRLLTGRMSRLDIADFVKSAGAERPTQQIRVRIWRNYAVEPMETWFKATGIFWGLNYEFAYMGYDDSLSFLDYVDDQEASCEVLMVDSMHYTMDRDDFLQWISDREKYLSAISGNPVVSVVLDDKVSIRSHSEIVSVHTEADGNPLFDNRYEKSTGSRLRPETHALIARELSCTWVASCFVPPKKLIVADLDYTLHEGVLGEGIDKIFVGDDHKFLQEELLAAKSRGFMLSFLSKNDVEDVRNLLRNPNDYRIDESDLVAIEASWEPKIEGMRRILELTRINQDAVIFVDDNPVELIQMKSAYPRMSVVNASDGPRTAAEVLMRVPGFLRREHDDLADIRISDLKSNEERDTIIRDGLQTYYLTASPSLQIGLSRTSDLERLVDLGKRSNQFNLVLARAGLDAYLNGQSAYVSLALSDRFSDSGVIGGIVLSGEDGDGACNIVDLFLSCRVLGRGLETTLICSGISAAMKHLGACNVRIPWIVSERNEPALTWLGNTFLDRVPESAGLVTVSLEEIESLSVPPEGVRCEINE